MNKLALIAATALTAATFGGAALAQDANGDATTSDFTTVDANVDGAVSWEEAFGAFPSLTEDLFNQADANGDGTLDEGEYANLVALIPGATESDSNEAAPQ